MSVKINRKLFAHRKLVIGTKHKKETVISPLLEKSLGVECFTLENYDTDLLGTFTGEVERKEDPIKTLRKKCLRAMEICNCDLGVASEGSFGPHPQIPFVRADDEFLIFIDRKNNLEIIERELSLKTNFDGSDIITKETLIEFATRAKFPSHALIIRKEILDTSEIVKGISDWDLLFEVFQFFHNKYDKAYLQTDMRAHHNPTRMGVIETATKKLVKKINTLCPHCKCPGFGITSTKPGLPCELCQLPTKSVLSYVYECQKCKYTYEAIYPHQKTHEEPTYCDFCNP
jgi:hypothetical protein